MPRMPDNLSITLNSKSIAVGDFENDGRLDLVYGSQVGSLIYFRGRPNWWEFEPPVIIDLPFAVPPPGLEWLINALATGDFNEDGKLDLVIGDEQTFHPLAQHVHVMLGNGDGTFQAGTAWGPDIPLAIDFAVEDFNGDGNLDLMCGTRKTTFTIAWGDGSGAFPTFVEIEAGPYTDHVDAADIDLDGDIDAVLSLTQAPPLILRNNGNGTFAQEPYAMTFGYGQAFGELNGDGWPDLICATDNGPTTIGSVFVLLNDQTGHFPTFAAYPVTTQPAHTDTGSSPVVADLDGDGRAEVVIGRQGLYAGSAFFRDQALVFHNAGGGTLEMPPVLYHHVGGAELKLAAADLNQDGHKDVIAFNIGTATLMVNDGQGRFLTARGTPMGPTIPQGGSTAMTDFDYLAEGDFNNDGRFDLAGVRQAVATPFLECTVMLQDQQGWFTTLFSVPLPERATSLALADFDRDGNLDMAVTTTDAAAPCEGDAVRVTLGNGDGTFGPLMLHHSAGKDPVHLAAADLNADTWPDLVVTTHAGPNCPQTPPGPLGVSVLLNNQDGTFPTSAHYDCGHTPHFTAIGDLNADTRPDLAVLTYPGGVTILLNNGDGTFGPHGPNFAPYGLGHTPPRWRPLVLADADGDGSPDMFVTRDYSPTLVANSGGTEVLLNDGNAVFQSVGVIGSGSIAHGTAAVDLDSDGNLDFVRLKGGTYGSGHMSVFLGDGDGTFGKAIAYGGGGQHGLVVVGDFDQDGRLDLGSSLGCSPDWDLADHAGFARLYNRMCPACYPDCNDSGSLTVADFTCFQTKFVAGDPYADCNQSGALTVADFTCFQTKFVAGCP